MIRGSVRTLLAVLRRPPYGRIAAALTAGYTLLFLMALGDIGSGGRGVDVLLTDWVRMFDRTGTLTFEAIALVMLPGVVILVSPLNIAIGLVLGILAGTNLSITYLALRQPRACRFNRATGVLASVPALLAGGACCAPAVVLLLGLQVSSLWIATFQAHDPCLGSPPAAVFGAHPPPDGPGADRRLRERGRRVHARSGPPVTAPPHMRQRIDST